MKKKSIFFILILISIILLIILWSYFNRDEEVINNTKEIVPQEEITEEQLRNTIISLYFINKENNEIEVENRLIDAKILLNEPYKELLTLWLNGANSNKLITGCSKNIKINNIIIENDCLVIDLSKEFIEEYEGENGKEINVIYCLVNTLTELKEINCVKILVDGQENQYLGNNNLSEKYYRLNN